MEHMASGNPGIGIVNEGQKNLAQGHIHQEIL